MDVSIEDMKSCIEEWFAQARDFEELAEILYAVKAVADKQFVFMAKEIAKDIKD